MSTSIFARRRQPARLATFLAVAAAVAAMTASAPAHAERIAWQGNRFEYVADRKDLKDVLRDFGASQHVMTWISPQVEGNVTGRFNSSPQQFLDKMVASFGVLWYYNGAVLRIYGPNEARSATLGLQHASTNDLRQALARLQIEDPRFPVRYDDVSRTAVVSGPPHLVDLVSDVARLIDHVQVSGDTVVVRRFPLRYASATDKTITINGRSVSVRGVAGLLRGLYGQAAPGAGVEPAPARLDTYRLPSVRESQDDGATRMSGNRGVPPLPAPSGLGGAAPLAGMPPGMPPGAPPGMPPGAAPMARAFDDDAGRGGRRGEERMPAAPAGPSIEADPRGNAILVRDRAENMPAYASLIESLDMRPGVLEIDATIIEITDSALNELGIDWRLHTGHVDLQTGNGQLQQAGKSDSLNPTGFGVFPVSGALPATPQGAVLTTVIGNAGKYLLNRISALQQNDQARVTASPRVETLDNVEALMDSKKTFYVQVAGYQSADLYSVSAGVSLRVLPSIITSPGGAQQIRMDVHIEDGKLTSQQVGQLPVVSNSTIDTQALINEGESLLIAGYSVTQDENTETAVPGLSKLPVIGDMFRYRKHEGQHYQRMFLLTPRVLSPAIGGIGATESARQGGVAARGGALPPLPQPAPAPAPARKPRFACGLKRATVPVAAP
jgi:type III secretion protein C